MTLSLVKVTHLPTNKSSYHAVNSRHYDAMLASGGHTYEMEYMWEWLGDIEISEEILNEEGLVYKDD